MKFYFLLENYSALPSPLAMAEWIEISQSEFLIDCFLSPLAMAEWIEIITYPIYFLPNHVSASDGGVD